MKTLLLSLLLITSFFAATVEIIKPLGTHVEDNGTIYIGKIGPGQPVAIDILKRVEGYSKKGYGNYDRAFVTEIPEGWMSKDSKLFDNPMEVVVTAPENASEGNYSFKISLYDWEHIEALPNFTINAIVSVTEDIFSADVPKSVYVVGPKQPARVRVFVFNKGNIGSVFIVKMKLPDKEEVKEVFVPAGHSAHIIFETEFEDENVYDGYIEVEPEYCPRLKKLYPLHFTVVGSFLGDLQASGRGILLLFVPFQPIYDLAYLVGVGVGGG